MTSSTSTSVNPYRAVVRMLPDAGRNLVNRRDNREGDEANEEAHRQEEKRFEHRRQVPQARVGFFGVVVGKIYEVLFEVACALADFDQAREERREKSRMLA